jgi:uncharacterized protein YodC (DUF2158 family)
MKTIEINVGDVVQLTSGGPRMTVDRIDHSYCHQPIKCIWFNKTDELKYAQFSHESLKVLNIVK